MNKFKSFIKKYFSSFAFFYKYLRSKIFIAFALSAVVSILDGFGLTMFIPLLQVVGKKGAVDASQLGKLAFIVNGFESLGIRLTLVVVLLIMLIFFIFKGGAAFLSQVYNVVLGQAFIRKIRINLLDKLNRMSFKKFILSDVGRIQNTMSGEVARVSLAFTTYFGAVQQAVMVLVYAVFAFFLNAQFAVLVVIGAVITNFLYRIIYKRTEGASRRLTRYNHVFQGQIIQHVGFFKYLRATGMSEKYGSKLKKTIYEIEYSNRKIGILAGIGTAAREPLLIAVIVCVIYVQVSFFSGDMATIMISLLFFYRALTFLVSMQQSWNSFMSVSGSMENMQNFEKELELSQGKDGNIKFEKFQKSITLEKVSFAYGESVILKDIGLEIKKNETLAFVGESGSGKTTLVSLIAGLLQEDAGQIRIDDTPLKDIKKETYQERIGYVSQDPVIFNDTIFNNVTFWASGTPENRARFEKSIRQASIFDFIQQLPKKEETELGNNGINLSGGQKQRISIARELYKDIDLLILDEATSALDSETERAIQESIDALQGQYTILIVAHRLSTIRNADRIVFMDKGKIMDIDTFEGLRQNQERFRKMVELQDL